MKVATSPTQSSIHLEDIEDVIFMIDILKAANAYVTINPWKHKSENFKEKISNLKERLGAEWII